MDKNSRRLIGWILLIILLVAATGGLISYVVFNQKGSGIIIGGCGGVALEHQQECCETWALENRIITPACVGDWIINEDNQCSWECGAG